MKSGPWPCVLILAGGKGSRCGGRDKGWLELDGEALIVRRLRELSTGNWSLAISANRTLDRYRELGVTVVTDATDDFAGPLAAIAAALKQHFGAPIVSIPVDAFGVSASTLSTLIDASDGGCKPVYACDDDGVQPLVAVWPASTQSAVAAALRSADRSVRALQHCLAATAVEFPGARFGNINTLADLEKADRELSAKMPC